MLSAYVLKSDAVLPPTVAALTLVIFAPLPEIFVVVMLVLVITVLTVALPTLICEVERLTLAPTLTAVEILAVAGSLAVFNVPDEMFVAFDANAVALE